MFNLTVDQPDIPLNAAESQSSDDVETIVSGVCAHFVLYTNIENTGYGVHRVGSCDQALTMHTGWGADIANGWQNKGLSRLVRPNETRTVVLLP